MPTTGPFEVGDRVQLTDAKSRKFTVVPEPGNCSTPIAALSPTMI